jgi:hypothetical protein
LLACKRAVCLLTRVTRHTRFTLRARAARRSRRRWTTLTKTRIASSATTCAHVCTRATRSHTRRTLAGSIADARTVTSCLSSSQPGADEVARGRWALSDRGSVQHCDSGPPPQSGAPRARLPAQVRVPYAAADMRGSLCAHCCEPCALI